MTAEELNILLYEKMQNEHREFIEKLKNSTPETVIECAYELVIREDILLSLEENELEPKQCKALLKEKEPLSKLFGAWEKHEGDHMKEILDCIENTADELVTLLKKEKAGTVDSMTQFSESDINRAREMDLLTYLKYYEAYELKRISRRVYSTRTHDSLKISNGRWMWWSRGIGGKSALDYLIKVKGMQFLDAVGLILGTQMVIPKEIYHKAKPPPKKFSLPKKAENNDKVVSYLMSRGISREVIDFFIDNGMLYQSSYRNNVVFVGYDEKETARYATMRSTNTKRFFCDVSGSDKRFSFRLTQKDADTIHIFESAIDLLSYMTIEKMQGADLKDQCLVSLSGINITQKYSVVPLALSSLVEKGEGIKIIHLHLDNDEPGQKVAEHLSKILSERYEVINHIIPYGKDVNDYLCHLKNINKNFNERSDAL